MHIAYKVQMRGSNCSIIKVEDFTRVTQVTPFHPSDADLAHRVCTDLTNALPKVTIICQMNK